MATDKAELERIHREIFEKRERGELPMLPMSHLAFLEGRRSMREQAADWADALGSGISQDILAIEL